MTIDTINTFTISVGFFVLGAICTLLATAYHVSKHKDHTPQDYNLQQDLIITTAALTVGVIFFISGMAFLVSVETHRSTQPTHEHDPLHWIHNIVHEPHDVIPPSGEYLLPTEKN